MLPALVIVVALAAPPDATVRLAVRPAPSPTPALKYQLLPEVRELQPGNPVQWYVRCFMEQRNFFFDKNSVAERERHLAVPLADLPAQQLRGYGGSALTQADWGARLDTPDWPALERVQTEGADVHFPELTALRVLGQALKVRLRGEVARGEFDAALGTAKTMFAFARHLGEHPTSVANLLGLEVADMAADVLHEMVQRPGCPNLYWALTDLPVPLVELRKGFQGDRAAVDAELRALRDGPMTHAQLDEFVGRLSGRAGFARERAGLPPRDLRGRLAARVGDPKAFGDAQVRLLAAGRWNVLKLPPLQVVLLDEKREFELRRDDALKLLALTPPQINTLRGDQPGRHDGLFADLLPPAAEARRVQARLEQRVAVLQHVEALRLYAAAHGGKLPATLDEVGVPLPADPFTGKPFGYTADGATARLRAAAPKGETRTPAVPTEYEITIRK